MTEKQKQANTIFYEQSSSEIKDDIPSLLDCWKGAGLGNKNSYALGRTESGFLLWYHAMNNPDSLQEMYDNNLVANSILVLDPRSSEIGNVTDTQRTIASNLLRLVVENEETRDKFLTAKGHTGTGFSVLTEALLDIAVGQEQIAGVLRMLSEAPKHRNKITSTFSPIPWKTYLSVISDKRNKNQKAKAELAFFVRYMTIGREDLKQEAGEAGAVRSLLEMLRTVKKESALNAAAGCMYRLTEVEEVLEGVADGEGIKILADLIGPPPKLYLQASIAEEKRRAEENEQREKATAEIREELKQMKLTMSRTHDVRPSGDNTDSAASDATESPGGKKPRKPKKATGTLPSISRKGSGTVTLSPDGRSQPISSTTPITKGKAEPVAEVFVMPRINVKYIPVELRVSPYGIGKPFQAYDVGKTSLCIQWSRQLSVQTRGFACAVLYNLALKEYHCTVLDSCGVAYRMCHFLKSMIAQPEPAADGKSSKKDKKGKKGKAAKLKLTPEEENAIVAITGCLRHMTMNHDANKARLVKYGAVPLLVQLYEQTSRNKIRWNCRGILNDVGSLHENGKSLDAMGIFPEEFLVYDPMHLLKSDLAQLQAEFAAEDAKHKAEPVAVPAA